MTFRMLVGCVLALLLSNCDWDEKHTAIDCQKAPAAGVVDCRTSSTAEDSEEPDDGIVGGDGDTIDLTRDPSKLQALVASGQTEWQKGHDDEIDVTLTAQGDRLYVISKYHNRLRIFQATASSEATLASAADFLQVPGARYAVDGTTGASEQVLNEIEVLTSDALLLGRVIKYDTNSSAVGVGLYVIPQTDANVVPQQLFSQVDAANFIAYGAIRASAISPDGSLIAVGGSDRRVKLYRVGEYAQPLREVKLNLSVRELAFSSDGETLYVGGLTIVGQMVALTTEDLSERWRKSVVDTPIASTAVGKDAVLVLPASGDQLQYFTYQNGEVKASSIPLAAAGTSLSYYAEHNWVAITDNEGGVELVSLKTGQRAYIAHGEVGKGAVFDHFGTLWVLNSQRLTGYRAPAGLE